MAFSNLYRRQVALLIRTLPAVTSEACFALKGGTAINLFIRNMPRLSVDIDLTYLPIEPRDASLAGIDHAMKRIATNIERAIPQSKVMSGLLNPENIVNKLFIRADGAQIKIEVTPVLRGCLHAPERRAVSPVVEDAFGFAEANVVSFPDLYGGKIVAALDRQHPRDLFDVRDLMRAEGIDEPLRQAFLVYLLSHNRPMAEVLSVRRKDILHEFSTGFQGMTEVPVSLDDLLAAREAVVKDVVGGMPEQHRRFLLSFERGEPDWPLLGVEGADKLPAIRWRQHNLDTLGREQRQRLVDQLARVWR
jgi:predicted nucleotidyltransferase component of viral defense system